VNVTEARENAVSAAVDLLEVREAIPNLPAEAVASVVPTLLDALSAAVGAVFRLLDELDEREGEA
jgi:hypothetical protein